MVEAALRVVVTVGEKLHNVGMSGVACPQVGLDGAVFPAAFAPHRDEVYSETAQHPVPLEAPGNPPIGLLDLHAVCSDSRESATEEHLTQRAVQNLVVIESAASWKRRGSSRASAGCGRDSVG